MELICGWENYLTPNIPDFLSPLPTLLQLFNEIFIEVLLGRDFPDVIMDSN